MNERIVEDVLADDGTDGPELFAFERVLRAAVFCALAFLALCAGSFVAGAVSPLVVPGEGFEAGRVTGVVTAGVAVVLLRRYWRRIDVVLPDPDDE